MLTRLGGEDGRGVAVPARAPAFFLDETFLHFDAGSASTPGSIGPFAPPEREAPIYFRLDFFI